MSVQVSFPFARQNSNDVVVQKRMERGREIAADHVIVLNVKPFKDCLVEFAAFQVATSLVVGGGRSKQLAAMFGGTLQLVLGKLGSAEYTLSGGLARSNS